MHYLKLQDNDGFVNLINSSRIKSQIKFTKSFNYLGKMITVTFCFISTCFVFHHILPAQWIVKFLNQYKSRQEIKRIVTWINTTRTKWLTEKQQMIDLSVIDLENPSVSVERYSLYIYKYKMNTRIMIKFVCWNK